MSGSDAAPPSAAEKDPGPESSRALDIGTVAAAWLVAFVVTFVRLDAAGWNFYFLWLLFIGPVIIWGLVVIQRSLAWDDVIRRRYGRVPRRYHVLGLVWCVALLALGLGLVDGTDAEDWTSPLAQMLGYPPESQWAYLSSNTIVAVAGPVLLVATIVLAGFQARDRKSNKAAALTRPTARDS